MLAVVGELDTSDIHGVVDRLVAKAPRARQAVIPGAGHTLDLENPREFDRRLPELLAERHRKARSPAPTAGPLSSGP